MAQVDHGIIDGTQGVGTTAREGLARAISGEEVPLDLEPLSIQDLLAKIS